MRTCLGYRLGRRWTAATGGQRPTTRTARGAAAPCCQDIPIANEKSQVPQLRYLTFLAGAEGLSLACRLGCCSLVGSAQHRPRREPRPVRSRAPLALAHPSARGFGVDVGESTRERGRGGVGRFLLQVTKRAVLGWCCEEISGPKGRENPGKAGNTLTRIDKDRIIKVPGLLPAGRLLQTGG